MIIIVGNGIGDQYSNPGQDWLCFTSLGKGKNPSILTPTQLECFCNFGSNQLFLLSLKIELMSHPNVAVGLGK